MPPLPFFVDRILAETGSETLKRRTPLLWPRWNITVKRKKRRLCPPHGAWQKTGAIKLGPMSLCYRGIRSNDYLLHRCSHAWLQVSRVGEEALLPSFKCFILNVDRCVLLREGVFEVMTSSRSRFFAKFIGGGLG